MERFIKYVVRFIVAVYLLRIVWANTIPESYLPGGLAGSAIGFFSDVTNADQKFGFFGKEDGKNYDVVFDIQKAGSVVRISSVYQNFAFNLHGPEALARSYAFKYRLSDTAFCEKLAPQLARKILNDTKGQQLHFTLLESTNPTLAQFLEGRKITYQTIFSNTQTR